MLELLKYILLGLVQGVAEVLPISSSAHLIIVQELMGINNDTLTFEVLLHLASLIALFFGKSYGN
jgi:undecaprenyl-diphosphatase